MGHSLLVPGAKSCGQPSGLKLGTKAGCGEIFQKPLWLTSLTFSFGVSGGGGGGGVGWQILPFEYQKSSLPGVIFKVRCHDTLLVSCAAK